jgi:hypothetical protein
LIEAREKEQLERERENEDDGDGLDVPEIRPCDEEVSRFVGRTSPLTWRSWYEAELVLMQMLISETYDLPFF